MSFQESRFYKLTLLSLAVVLLFTVSLSQQYLNLQRDSLGLTRITPLENAPPVLAFTTVALGGFRGLIANALWIRATDLQEADKYFEMVQLAEWITTLQPHFTTVWVHQAWNMAYNISIKFNDPNDRWLWVLRGVELLRDRGLLYNPKEPLIYRELSWFYQHKIGANLDDGHEYYKRKVAEEMNTALGGGKPKWEDLIDPKTDEFRQRTTMLREKLKMEPRFMKEVDERYGPLEWRLPETLAIYWAYVGLRECVGAQEKDLVQLRRNIFQSMQTAFHRGRMIFPVKGTFDFTYGPNIDIIDKVNKAYEEMIEQEPDLKDNLRNGHKNLLKTAVYFLFTYNRLKSAEEWFKYLHEKYPDSLLTPEQLSIKFSNPNAKFPPKTLNEYAIERVTEEIGDGGVDRTKAMIEGYLQNYYISLAQGEDDRATGFERYSRIIWQSYMDRMGESAQKRVGLPPLNQLKQEMLDRMLDSENGLGPELANQLRTALGMPAQAIAPQATDEQGKAVPATTPPLAPAQPNK
ncbi:MAG: hypothetical protein EXS31_16210 [Pedosphaera sp.]|nr:hypothetical protein [Pedosphaera sp.]